MTDYKVHNMQVPFIKMHGAGNIILVVDQREQNWPPPTAVQLLKLGDERSGPAFDQMMWVTAATDGKSVASYRVFNADGSEIEQCGNGVRCVARYLSDVGEQGKQFSLQSPAGLISAEVFADGQVAVGMGTPIFEPARIPFIAEVEAKTYSLSVDDNNLEVFAVSMGNPHCVMLVDDVGSAPVGNLGPLIEHHERFPKLTNVGFMHIIDRQNIDLRVHERGVGETAACGTGACAAVVSGQRQGLLDEKVSVHLPGGQVVVSWRGDDTPAWLKGNAEVINEGSMDLQE
jgi:diaminopimelate epimerase